MNAPTVNFDKLDGLVPCVIQDNTTGKVLMLGFMNEEAYQKTLQQKRVTFFSRSKQRLWTKGETSGNYLDVVIILTDCDNDTLLIKVNPHGPVCHTGEDTCFREKNMEWSIHTLEKIIHDRKQNPAAGSYTNNLLDAGINKVAQKVGEEAIELVIEAKDDDRDLFLGEAADLMYHYLVLLCKKGYSLRDVTEVLEKRHAR
jgi:phosphoribosyl-AMP cyclohydrolase / phosphoribosyl-ATP pyrophosphohydrolase